MRERLNRLEAFLMEVARGFGTILMSLTLVGMTLLLLIFLVSQGCNGARKVSQLFERSTPKVVFYKGDFAAAVPGSTVTSVPTSESETRPDPLPKRMARQIVSELAPIYDKSVDEFLQAKGDQIGLTKPEDRARYKDGKTAEYKNENVNVFPLTNLLMYEAIPNPEDYTDKLIDYCKEASKGGVSVFPDGMVSIYYSPVRMKFHQLYMEDLQKIHQRDASRKESDNGMEKLIGYGILFALITLFLMQAMVFSIFRIEKKMGQK